MFLKTVVFNLPGRHSLQSFFLSIQESLFAGWLGGQVRNLMASSFIANIVNGRLFLVGTFLLVFP